MIMSVPEHAFEWSCFENKKPKPNPECSAFRNCSTLSEIFPSMLHCKLVIAFFPSNDLTVSNTQGNTSLRSKLAASNLDVSLKIL